jgi:hypothetical protein
MTDYWKERETLGYYVLVRAWLNMLSIPLHAMDTSALLDVGCLDTPTATWGYFNHRYTVDLEHDPKLAGVVSHVGSFLEWTPPHRMTVVTCLQVLEHLPDTEIRRFADKLLACADHTIVSVPYEWPKGDEPAHLQDPISQEKFERMMGRPPLEQVIVHDGKRLRIVARWENL